MGTSQVLATWFGCGRSRWAPGTVGTLGSLPLYWLLRHVSLPAYLAALAGVTAAGVWAAQQESERLGSDDPPSVVIDEVAGALLALAFARGRGWRSELTALALFRLLDIWKPGPIRAAERLRPAGAGIVADDLLAGAAAGLLSRLL